MFPSHILLHLFVCSLSISFTPFCMIQRLSKVCPFIPVILKNHLLVSITYHLSCVEASNNPNVAIHELIYACDGSSISVIARHAFTHNRGYLLSNISLRRRVLHIEGDKTIKALWRQLRKRKHAQ